MKTGIDTLQTEFNLYTCKTCAQDFPIRVEKHFFTYGTDAQGNKHCVECCGKNDLKDAQETGKFFGYLTLKETHTDRLGCSDTVTRRTWTVSNWPGTLAIPAYHSYQTRHNFGGKVTHVWFKFPDDPFVWYGKQIGDNNQILRAKRTKKEKF